MLQLTFHADGWIKHDKASTATSYLDANTAVPVHYELTPIPDGKTAHAYPMMNDGFFPRNDVNYTKSIRCFALRIGTPKKYKNGLVCKITPTLPSAEKCVLAQNLPQGVERNVGTRQMEGNLEETEAGDSARAASFNGKTMFFQNEQVSALHAHEMHHVMALCFFASFWHTQLFDLEWHPQGTIGHSEWLVPNFLQLFRSQCT